MTSREPDGASNGEEEVEETTESTDAEPDHPTEGEADATTDESEADAEDAESDEAESDEEAEDTDADDPLVRYGREVAAAVGGKAEVAFGTIKVRVPVEKWVVTHERARDDLDLPFFSFLGVIEWTNDTATGDPLTNEVEERFEVISTVSDVTAGRRITFSTDISHDNPVVPTLVDVYAGANWHEREEHEMFGVHFDGHPDLSPLYLPDGFVGNPLRKSFALLTREVKPWPGTVDVEGMPEEEDGAGDEGGEDTTDEEVVES